MASERTESSRAIARLGAVAEVLSLAAGEIVAVAALCAGGFESRAQIAIDGDFTDLSLVSALPAEPAASQVVAELGRRDRMFGKRADAWIERGACAVRLEHTASGLAFALISDATCRADDDFDRLRRHTHAGRAIERAGELLGDYTGSGGQLVSIADHFRPPAHHSWVLGGRIERGDDIDLVLGPLAERLAIRSSQVRLLAAMHPILGGRDATRFGVRVGPGVIYPELGMHYRDVDVELLIRLLIGLDINRDPGEPLGRFLGALGAPERVSVVELTLTAEGPPRIRAGVELV